MITDSDAADATLKKAETYRKEQAAATAQADAARERAKALREVAAAAHVEADAHGAGKDGPSRVESDDAKKGARIADKQAVRHEAEAKEAEARAKLSEVQARRAKQP